MSRCETCKSEFIVPESLVVALSATHCRNCIRKGLEHVTATVSQQEEVIRSVIADLLERLDNEEEGE